MQTSASQTIAYAMQCRYTGVPIGLLHVQTVAGALPYLSHWKEMQAAHPLFSLPPAKLLAFTRSTQQQLAALSELEDPDAVTAHEKLLQIAFVAVLHSLGSIQQERAALPALELVQTQLQRVFALAYKKQILASKRLSFPTFKISRINQNEAFENIAEYLTSCFDVMNAFERGVQDAVEEEKVRLAEEAMRKLRDSWIVPVGKKSLWKWVRAHLAGTKYEADAAGWISTLFLGAQKTVLEFDSDETDLMEDIILSTAPGGNGIMAAVRAHIASIRKLQQDNKEAFTVDFGEYTTAEFEPAPEPQQKDFATKVEWIRARARWHLQQRAAETPPPAPRTVRVIEESEF